MEHRWSDTTGEIEVLAEKPIPVPFVSNKVHTDWPGIKRVPSRWEAGSSHGRDRFLRLLSC